MVTVMRKSVPFLLVAVFAILLGCGGGGGSGGGSTTATTSTTSGTFLQYAAPGDYVGSIDDFPNDRSCVLTIQPDPNDPSKPKPLADENDFNCSVQLDGSSSGIPGRIDGSSLTCWNPTILVLIEKEQDGRIRIWADKPGPPGQTWINVKTPGPIVNPPPPVP